MAAQARVGMAQAAWFPNIALTASAGYASPELSDLFKWSSRAWVLGALSAKDVEDQLAALRLLTEQAQAQGRAVASASRTTSLSDTRYRVGYVSQLELLDAQRSELRNRREALQVRSARYQATVALVRALGGDWKVE